MLAVRNRRCTHQFYPGECLVSSCEHAEPAKEKKSRVRNSEPKVVPLITVPLPVKETASQLVARSVAMAEEYRERAHWRVSQWMHDLKR